MLLKYIFKLKVGDVLHLDLRIKNYNGLASCTCVNSSNAFVSKPGIFMDISKYVDQTMISSESESSGNKKYIF